MYIFPINKYAQNLTVALYVWSRLSILQSHKNYTGLKWKLGWNVAFSFNFSTLLQTWNKVKVTQIGMNGEFITRTPSWQHEIVWNPQNLR